MPENPNLSSYLDKGHHVYAANLTGKEVPIGRKKKKNTKKKHVQHGAPPEIERAVFQR